MSHFTVLVVGDDHEALLRPFQENNMGDCPKELLAFHDSETEMLQEYETGSTERVVMPDGSLKLPWDDCFRVPGGFGGFGSDTHKVPENLEKREVPFKETYATFEEYAKDWCGDEERDEQEGRFGYWENAPKYKVGVCCGLASPKSEGTGHEETRYTGGNEALSKVWTDEAIRRFLASEKEQRRKVYLLSPLSQGEERHANARASATLAPLGQVRHHSGTVSGAGDSTGREVRDLSNWGGGEGTQREVLGSGPLSSDWEGEGAFMLQLQHALGDAGGELQLCDCGSGVPHEPHVLSTALISGSKWDWYQVGGRWTGFFLLKKDANAPAVVGSPGLMTPPAEPGWTDQARKGDIDFDGMRDDAEREARWVYGIIVGSLGHAPDHNPWSFYRESTAYGEGREQWDAKRDAYHNQPSFKTATKALREKAETPGLEEKERDLLRWVELDNFLCTEEEYVQRHRDQAFSTFALLKDGQWYEKGKMGWWACVSDPKDEDEWLREFNLMLDALPDDTTLTVVDCHI